jgi:hypothetical protein
MGNFKWAARVLAAGCAAAMACAASAEPLADYGDALGGYNTAGTYHVDPRLAYLAFAGGDAPTLETAPKPPPPPLPGFDEADNGVIFKGSSYDQGGISQCSPNPFTYVAACWGHVTVGIFALNHLRFTGGPLYLDAWLDYGHNGVFGDESGTIQSAVNAGTAWTEHIISAIIDPSAFTSDYQSFDYSFMNGEGPNGPYWARFRLSYGEGANAATGAKDFGEVEDYGSLQHAGGGQIPVPPTIWLVLTGLLGLAAGSPRRIRLALRRSASPA